MFEQWQSFGDKPLNVCVLVHDNENQPCEAPVKRVFSKVGISFKGDGFYKNDHGANARARATEKSSKDTSNSDSTSGSKSDTKTDSTGTKKDAASSKSNSGGGSDSKTSKHSATNAA
ncbi:MAG: FmdB family transcriptional regulator [Acidimicrobiia bacterium]|nr:FmdB family transcriptional regulator [Acidimicrobiia bacterium]